MAKEGRSRFNGMTEVNMTAKVIKTVVAFAALVLAIAPSGAQSGGTISAQIPFEFAVGGKLLPAGEYIFDLAGTTTPNVLTVRAQDGSTRVMFDTDQLPVKQDPESVALVFDKIGNTSYLMEVWGLENSGRGVKNIVDGVVLKRAPEESRRRITAVRVVPREDSKSDK